MRSATVRARRGRLSALSVSLCKSVFYGTFVWARRALNSQKTAVSGPARAGCGSASTSRRTVAHLHRAAEARAPEACSLKAFFARFSEPARASRSASDARAAKALEVCGREKDMGIFRGAYQRERDRGFRGLT
jgi:hypothetical protein